MTVTLYVQVPPIAIVAPVRAVTRVPAVFVSVPPQVVAELVAIVRPVGSVMEKATPVSATVLPLGFVSVTLSELVLLTGVLVGLKTIEATGGAMTSVVSVRCYCSC